MVQRDPIAVIVDGLMQTIGRREGVIAEQRATLDGQDAILRSLDAQAARKGSLIEMLRAGGANDG